MSEHMHEWWVDTMPTEARCVYTDEYGEECPARMTAKEIERRLNATEQLSAENARDGMKLLDQTVERWESYWLRELMRSYAAALEGE